jgi:hypothetical protein
MKTLEGIYLHLHNPPTRNTTRMRQNITRTETIRVVYPAYSADAALCDFFLFGYLKGEMADFTVDSPADILSEIRRIFQEISKETLVAVYDEWVTRLE